MRTDRAHWLSDRGPPCGLCDAPFSSVRLHLLCFSSSPHLVVTWLLFCFFCFFSRFSKTQCFTTIFLSESKYEIRVLRVAMCTKIPVYRNPTNQSIRANTCQNDEKNRQNSTWRREQPYGRTAYDQKKNVKIHDFCSRLREKNDFQQTLDKQVICYGVLGGDEEFYATCVDPKWGKSRFT